MAIRAVGRGTLATIILLTVYGLVLTLVSGWEYMLDQFAGFSPYIITLAIGFGIQVALYSYLRQTMRDQAYGGVVAVSGATSTVAMVSCCTHYLVNLLPVLGATGLVVFVSQYQIELFWVGIVANLAGISYMLCKIKTVLYA